MNIAHISLTTFLVLSATFLAGCNRTERVEGLGDRLLEMISIAFSGGTTTGYYRCLENNQNTGLTPDTTIKQCRSRYAKPLLIEVEGKASYQRSLADRFSGWIKNVSKNTVITSYVVVLTNTNNKDKTGKPIPERHSFDGRWIEPGNLDPFEIRDLKFVPLEEPKKGDWSWSISDMKGFEIVLRVSEPSRNGTIITKYTDWLTVSVAAENFGVSFTAKAFSADIPLPGIKEIIGKTKFIEDSSDNTTVKLGYVVAVAVDRLDKSKVPQKYLREKPIVIERAKLTRLPIDDVMYEVSFLFALKDRDGFELLNVESKPEKIISGKKNELQGIGQQQIPVGIVNRLSHIQLKTVVTKCVTCEG